MVLLLTADLCRSTSLSLMSIDSSLVLVMEGLEWKKLFLWTGVLYTHDKSRSGVAVIDLINCNLCFAWARSQSMGARILGGILGIKVHSVTCKSLLLCSVNCFCLDFWYSVSLHETTIKI